MRYRHRCGYEIDEERFSRAFLASLRANRRRHGHGMSHVPDMSEGDSDRSDDRWAKYEDDMATDSAPTREHGGEKLIHPALMNAVLLLGCHFATLNGSPSAMTARGASRLPSLPQQRSSRSSETPRAQIRRHQGIYLVCFSSHGWHLKVRLTVLIDCTTSFSPLRSLCTTTLLRGASPKRNTIALVSRAS